MTGTRAMINGIAIIAIAEKEAGNDQRRIQLQTKSVPYEVVCAGEVTGPPNAEKPNGCHCCNSRQGCLETGRRGIGLICEQSLV